MAFNVDKHFFQTIHNVQSDNHTNFNGLLEYFMLLEFYFILLVYIHHHKVEEFSKNINIFYMWVGHTNIFYMCVRAF